MQMAENWTGLPDDKPILQGVLQKTSGTFGSYAPRHVALHKEHIYLYQCSDQGGIHSSTPYSRIMLAYVTVANSAEELPTGFSLTTLDGDKEVGFLTESVEAKNVWVMALHEGITALGRNTAHLMASGRAGSEKNIAIIRTGKVEVEGFMEKRQGTFGSYHTRWCELRSGESIAYSKYKSSSDDSFKHIPLRGKRVTVNRIKMRFAIEIDGDTVYLKCQCNEDFQMWFSAIQAECKDHMEGMEAALSNLTQDDEDDDEDDGDINLDYDDDDEGDGETGAGDEEEAFEMADLASPEPIHNNKYEDKFSTDPNRVPSSQQQNQMTPQRGTSAGGKEGQGPMSPLLVGYGPSSPENLFKPITLQSISTDFQPRKNTHNYDKLEINPFVNSLDYNLQFKMQRFYERMHVPLRGPYSAIYEHINLLDLEAKLLKALLHKLLEKFGHEESLRPLVSDMDAMLRCLPGARAKFLIYREMAEYREQKGKGGLKLGINGTVHFIDQLTRRTRETPTREQLASVEKAANSLDSCIEDFRLQFDVYDESIEAIHEMERALQKADEWIGLHKLV